MEDLKSIQLQDVFVLSGVPTHTFVKPVEYTKLLVSLRTHGRGVVVEGPSGIGKTTAVVNAIKEASIHDKVILLSARKPDDLLLINELPKQRPFGIVIIDDFQRLQEAVKKQIADLMKVLADESASDSKLVLLGITNAGQSLVSFGRDLTNRIEVIQFESNPDEKIKELIEKGENSLNATLNISDEIIKEAQGSFYLAQMLAYETCIKAKILERCTFHVYTQESYESIKSSVMSTLKRSFHDTAISFCRGTKLRREGRAPYLHLLHWLSRSDNWMINTDKEIDLHPKQSGSVSQVVTKGYLESLILNSDDIQKVLHFDSVSRNLVVQDPQFMFYIRNLQWQNFGQEVGFINHNFSSEYDFALSFAGSDRDIAEALFKKLDENEIAVFYDRNEQHRILASDVEEYLQPIYSSDAKFIICILGRDYPNRIWTKFESTQFKQRFNKGEVIPIKINDSTLGVFDTASQVGYMSFDRDGDFDDQITQISDLLIKKIGDTRLATVDDENQTTN